MKKIFMKKSRVFTFTILFVLFLGSFSPLAFAAPTATTVKVGIPAFQITLNGQVIDNGYRQYPLIVYKDITYFPMTYNDSRFLGLGTQFDSKTGLAVTQFHESWPYDKNISTNKNSGAYTAIVANFPIKVNGKTIDNSKETYPLLSFRDVTYFPLTWRFAVDEFQWQYQFSEKSGLVIGRSDGVSTIPKDQVATTVTITYDQTKEGKLLSMMKVPALKNLIEGGTVEHFELDGSYIYFMTKDKTLKRMDINGTHTEMLTISGGVLSQFTLQQGYIIYTLNSPNGSYLKTVVLAPSGKIAMETTDKIASIKIDSSGNIQYILS